MSNFLLSKSEQGIVIFHVWKSLKYKSRLFLSALLILTGFIMQYYLLSLLPGVILVFAGNLLLLVKGYDTRIKLQGYKPDKEWVKTNADKLSEIVKMNARIKKWDVSAMDVTSSPGCLLFIVILALLVILFVFSNLPSDVLLIIVVNALVLLLPHWLTGLRRISTTPALFTKIDLFQRLLATAGKEIEQDTVNFLTLIDDKNKVPTDVKMKVTFKDQPEDFMGFYAQISMNNVQGTQYPYFYVVLVAREKSKLLSKKLNSIQIPDNVVKEFDTESEMEIVVIRQTTTKNSGYHTKEKAINTIFRTGIEAAKLIMSS